MKTPRCDAEMSNLNQQYQALLQLWMLRALLGCDGVSTFLRENRFSDRGVARFLGISEARMNRYSEAGAYRLLSKQLADLERAAPAFPTEPLLARNIERLAQHLQFSAVERDIVHFTVVQRLHSGFGSALDMVGDLARASLVKLLAVCLGHPMRAVQQALDDRSRLCRSALLKVDDDTAYPFSNKVDLLDGLAESLMLEHDDLLDLFATSIVFSPMSRLTLADFAYMQDDLTILTGYLDEVCRQHQRGVNVLIHGRPGTGKTELVRVVARALGAQLMEIPSELPTGQPRAGKKRFESFRLAQSLLEGASRQLLLFDEIEDVFSMWSGERNRREGNSSGIKGWVNQVLERNPMPTFWVTNDLESIDPAYRRRFDYVLHLDVPPASVRRRMLDQHLGALELPDTWRELAASHDELVPAVVQRAAKVCAVVCEVQPTLSAQQVLTRVMNNTLLAMGTAALPTQLRSGVSDYRLDWLNADCDLARLREGLQREGSGRICLWGPPGTGKTEFGRHVASQLDRPLLVRRASDILSPYAGMAERHIARMFEQARQEQAVLLLDEADSFLRDRRGAQHSWEVTQVNEMLTQMESFEGVFIASTNLMDDIDEAAMRRFDACIRLGYLAADQIRAMLTELARQLGLSAAPGELEMLADLQVLAPGDFAAVRRGARLHAPESIRELAERLRQACAAKADQRRREIGFLTRLDQRASCRTS